MTEQKTDRFEWLSDKYMIKPAIGFIVLLFGYIYAHYRLGGTAKAISEALFIISLIIGGYLTYKANTKKIKAETENKEAV